MITYNPTAVARDPDTEVLIDADCVGYWGAAGCDTQALASATHRIDVRMNQILDECQAGKYTGYLTGKGNFRDAIATLRRYKGNRYDAFGNRIKEQPEWLKECREYLIQEWDCILEEGQEADDALGIHRSRYPEDSHRVIISSIDKDLKINPGLHHNMNTGEIEQCNGFGEIKLKKGKVHGYGLKFFYAQMIMGDNADHIRGLPKVTEGMKEVWPKMRRGGAGDMTAYRVLENCKDELQAHGLVWYCYQDYWTQNSYTHWNDKNKVYPKGLTTARKQFIEQGRLLWMRRKENELWEPRYPLLKMEI